MSPTSRLHSWTRARPGPTPAYDRAARTLAAMFAANFRAYADGVSAEIRDAGPQTRPEDVAAASALDTSGRRAAALYAVVGLATGVLIAGVALAVAGLVLDGELARQARDRRSRPRARSRRSGSRRACISTPCVPSGASRRAAGAEIAAVAIYLVVMVTLILSDAALGAVIAVSGALPLLSGADLRRDSAARRALRARSGRSGRERAPYRRDRPDRRIPAGG